MALSGRHYKFYEPNANADNIISGSHSIADLYRAECPAATATIMGWYENGDYQQTLLMEGINFGLRYLYEATLEKTNNSPQSNNMSFNYSSVSNQTITPKDIEIKIRFTLWHLTTLNKKDYNDLVTKMESFKKNHARFYTWNITAAETQTLYEAIEENIKKVNQKELKYVSPKLIQKPTDFASYSSETEVYSYVVSGKTVRDYTQDGPNTVNDLWAKCLIMDTLGLSMKGLYQSFDKKNFKKSIAELHKAVPDDVIPEPEPVSYGLFGPSKDKHKEPGNKASNTMENTKQPHNEEPDSKRNCLIL